ncbi:MAG: multiheme c-type cytochrome [Deltaproteobacteria bacterium]|nr:multiheme c-type cytochrome [Deltaproteobacteria bacterium]
MEEVKKGGSIPLILDSGNLFFNQNPIPDEMKAQMRLKADLLADAYKKIGIDALNVGELDLAFGVNYLFDKRKNPGLPFVSSNIVYRVGGKEVFQPYIAKEVKGVKVAIFGLIPLLPNLGNNKDIKLLSPFDTARTMIGKLKGKADLIILLSNLGQQEDEKLAREVPGIDLIVGGRTRVLLQTPVKIGNTLILQAQAQGKQIGRLDLNPTTKAFVNSMTPMDEKVAKNEEIDGMVKRYKDAVVTLHSERPQPKVQEPFLKTYIGEAECARCHPAQSAFWKETSHARAYETLVVKKSHMDLECIGCHTTGYGVPGGFRLRMEAPDLRNVQCEACHGPGGRHMGKGDIRRIIDPSVCTGCHNKERDPKFNFISSVGKVRCPNLKIDIPLSKAQKPLLDKGFQ